MNYEPTTTAPSPTVKAEFHVERHPDPIVQALIERVQQLEAEKLSLSETITKLKGQQ